MGLEGMKKGLEKRHIKKPGESTRLKRMTCFLLNYT